MMSSLPCSARHAMSSTHVIRPLYCGGGGKPRPIMNGGMPPAHPSGLHHNDVIKRGTGRRSWREAHRRAHAGRRHHARRRAHHARRRRTCETTVSHRHTPSLDAAYQEGSQGADACLAGAHPSCRAEGRAGSLRSLQWVTTEKVARMLWVYQGDVAGSRAERIPAVAWACREPWHPCLDHQHRARGRQDLMHACIVARVHGHNGSTRTDGGRSDGRGHTTASCTA